MFILSLVLMDGASLYSNCEDGVLVRTRTTSSIYIHNGIFVTLCGRFFAQNVFSSFLRMWKGISVRSYNFQTWLAETDKLSSITR